MGGSEKLLSVGDERVSPDARLSVAESRLTITAAQARDAGDYICHFDTEPPVSRAGTKCYSATRNKVMQLENLLPCFDVNSMSLSHPDPPCPRSSWCTPWTCSSRRR